MNCFFEFVLVFLFRYESCRFVFFHKTEKNQAQQHNAFLLFSDNRNSMGSCTSSNRRSRNRLSRTNLTAEHLYQSIFLQRLSNFRNYSPYSLNALIDETLLMIRTVVDNDQEPPHAMFLVSRIANREDRWLDVICALIERIPIDDPLGATVIALLLDECSPPSDESMQQLIKRMCSNNRARVKYLQTILDDYIKQMAPNSTQTQISEQQLVTSSANSDKTFV